MSRWTANFASHAFNAQWKRLLGASEMLLPDDATLLPHLEEISRLRKVLAYVDQAILSVDPELLPFNFWDHVRDQMSACADQLIAFSSSKNAAQVHQANQNLDSILLHLRPYIFAKGKLGPALQSAAKAYATTLNEAADSLRHRTAQALSEVEKDRTRAAELLTQVVQDTNEVNEAHNEFLVDSAEREATNTMLKRHIEEISSFHRRLTAGGAENISIKEEVAAARENIKVAGDTIDSRISEVSAAVKGLISFEAKILGAIKEDGVRHGGLSSEIERRLTTLTDVESQQVKRYAALNEEIESLLPGATSAGLASAYKEMKDSFSQPIRRANSLFYSSIGLIVALSLAMNVEGMGLWWIDFTELTDWTSVGRSFAHKLPFLAPLVWLAYYASKRRSEFQRLEQEYAHKEALAKSYESYRRQIADLGADNDVLMRDLLAKAVEAIAFNASMSLDGNHGDKIPIQEAIERAVAAVAKAQKEPV